MVTDPTPVVAPTAGAGLKVLFIGHRRDQRRGRRAGRRRGSPADHPQLGQHRSARNHRGVELLHVDVRDTASVRAALGDGSFDVVADFVAFTPEQVAADIALFAGRTGQYVFISSASAYQKPPARLPILESTPLRNPFWQYARDKIACEDLLVRAYREDGFPVTIIRPSSHLRLDPIALTGGWTDIARLRAGGRSWSTATGPPSGL